MRERLLLLVLGLLSVAGLVVLVVIFSGPSEPPPEATGPPVDPEHRLTDAPEAPLPLEPDCGAEALVDPEEGLANIGAAFGDSPFEGRLPFAVKFGNEVSPFRLMSFSVMPAESVSIEPVLFERGARFAVAVEGGALRETGPNRWTWWAPVRPGIYCLNVAEQTTGEVSSLNAFVLEPYFGSEAFDGYRIGQYETIPLNADPAYNRPRGLIRVTEANRDTWVSPHFQLKQFACKQTAEHPKFLVLRARLLLKLEMLLERANDAGIEAPTFFVMSAYRTPWYNRAIGNSTRYSRHSYGDAADIFVDRDRDGRMDDIDGDGRVTLDDARRLYRIIDDLQDEAWYAPLVGGLGLYGSNPVHGPFIHVDTRGQPARW